jgi:hypothetical protein
VRSLITFRSVAAAAICGVCPLLCGCFAIGWAYPTAAFVPAISLGTAQDVRAFRIDVKDDRILHPEHSPGSEKLENDYYVISEMTARIGERLYPQAKLAVDYGQVSSPSVGRETTHLLLVRLYRPGYKTIEIQPWQLSVNPEWQAATTPAARERAIDDLVSTFARDDSSRAQASNNQTSKRGSPEIPPRDSTVFARLAPGSESDTHRAAILFAASEYELLSRGDVTEADREFSTRVMAKAVALRKLAVE